MSLRSFTIEQGRLLKMARRDAGKTRREIAAAIRRSAATVGRWERGEGSPTLGEVYTLARFLRLPLRRLMLLGGDGESLDLSDLPPEFRELVRDHVRRLADALRR